MLACCLKGYGVLVRLAVRVCALQEAVLDDLELLSTLRHAKAVSESCAERLKEHQQAQAAAEATLSLYSPVAQRAASLFQVLQQLERAHPMYLFSVQIFQQCFVDAVLVLCTASKPLCLIPRGQLAVTCKYHIRP